MILDSIRPVVSNSRHVRIDRVRLSLVCSELDPAQLRLPDWQVPVLPAARDEQLVDVILLFNSINFCYWGEPKWTVQFRGQSYDGAFGMMAALTRALEEDGLPLLEGDFLARIAPDQFRYLLRGNVPIPLEGQRLAIWHREGPVLSREFGGRWFRVVERADGSAANLVKLLVTWFPTWNDAAELDGNRVVFLKRAQLAAGMLYQAFGGTGWGDLADLDRLTVYADYKLPQVMRRLGILIYDQDLSALVDSQTPIPAGCRMEVEIRAATVWAGELMRRALVPRSPGITACHIDYWLWETGQHKVPGARPYHRTLTTAY